MAVREDRRCPKCGALVGPDAAWCGQCFARLGEPGTQPGPAPGGPNARPSSASPNGHGPAADEEPERPPGEEPTWPCGVCGESNSMGVSVCRVCLSPFGKGFESPEPERKQVPASRAVVWSLVFPGLGQAVLGHGLDGLSRAVVFLWSLGSAAAFLSVQGKARTSAVSALAVLFLLIALVIYALTALDARRLAEGREQVLSSRALIWVSAGLVLFSVGSAGLILAQGFESVRK